MKYDEFYCQRTIRYLMHKWCGNAFNYDLSDSTRGMYNNDLILPLNKLTFSLHLKHAIWKRMYRNLTTIRLTPEKNTNHKTGFLSIAISCDWKIWCMLWIVKVIVSYNRRQNRVQSRKATMCFSWLSCEGGKLTGGLFFVMFSVHTNDETWEFFLWLILTGVWNGTVILCHSKGSLLK